MAEAIYHQGSFLGGEWAKLAQGRSDLTAYKTAMNVCLNGIPVVEGAWVRRSGTLWLGPTILKGYVKLARYPLVDSYTMIIEFAQGVMRFFTGTSRVTTNDDRTVAASSSSSGTLSLTLDTDHGWSVGDFVFLPTPGVGYYLNRVMTISNVPATDQLALTDYSGDAFGFDSANDALLGNTVKRIKEIKSTGYVTSDLPDIKVVPAFDQAVILAPNVQPKTLPISLDSSGTIVFGSLASIAFQDGPYLDAQETSPGVDEVGTVSAYTGSITFIPQTTTFTADDVGRLIRLFHEPAAWDDTHTYAYGEYATYNDEWWMSIATGDYASSNVGIAPGTLATVDSVNVVLWAAAPEAGRWGWGTITAQASTSCTVLLSRDLNSANGTAISQWRLGVYKVGQYPSCGTFHDGRLVLGGALPNRIDAGKSNDMFNFAPTDQYGNVADDNAIGMELNFNDQQTVRWLASDEKGVVVGTEGGEILITSESGITPYDREAKMMTHFGVTNIEPCRVGSSLVFAQYYRRQLVEYKPTTLGTRFEGTYINEFSRHLTSLAIRQIAYQATPTPIIWALDMNGNLAGVTYRRDGDNLVNAGHRHEIADGNRYVADMVASAKPGWKGDVLYLVTYAPNNGYDDTSNYSDGTDFAIEILMPLLSERE